MIKKVEIGFGAIAFTKVCMKVYCDSMLDLT